MSPPRLRPAARGLVIDTDDRLLLCRFDLPQQDVVVWTAPGGGVEPGEDLLAALRRELDEELGLVVVGEAVHVWHQRVVAPGHVLGYDGAVNDYFLVPADSGEANVVLHVADALVDPASPAVIAADLAEHNGPREDGRVEELLRGLR